MKIRTFTICMALSILCFLCAIPTGAQTVTATLQGQVFDSNWLIPGTLIAFRDDVTAPWTLAIVRRVERQAENRVDIGVEYIGRKPRGVKITVTVSGPRNDPNAKESPTIAFAALFLPESATHPVLPVKTLILPSRKFAPGDQLTLRSVTALYTIELKEPIEEQSGFIWTPFEILVRTPRTPAVAPGA